MDTGSIKKLLKGFGFIAREGSSDLFFSATELVGVKFDDLREGEKVQFTAGEGPKGPNATQVSRMDSDAGTDSSAQGEAEVAEGADSSTEEASSEEASSEG